MIKLRMSALTISLVLMSSVYAEESPKVTVTDQFALPIVPAEVLKKKSAGERIVQAEMQADQKGVTTSALDVKGSAPQQVPVKPATPVKTLKAVSPERKQEVVNAKPEQPIEKPVEGTMDAAPMELVIKDGETHMLPISVGHPNRLITPFQTPRVKKLDPSLTVEVVDNVLYVATNQPHPVTIYIREDGTEGFAVPLILFPKKIPPRQVTLRFSEESRIAMPRGSKKAEAWETKESYQTTLKQLLTSVARGQTPSGYVLRNVKPSDYLPYCKQLGLDFDFSSAQVLEGHRLSVIVGTLTNTHDQSVEFVETNCLNSRVKAIAAWPEVFLNPGQKSELYLVINRETAPKRVQKRPSLI
jgi:conjugal transfer pilus assembly protein TraK